MDTSTLKTLDNTFRAITAANSITPNTVATLLDRFADMIATAPNTTELQSALAAYTKTATTTALADRVKALENNSSSSSGSSSSGSSSTSTTTTTTGSGLTPIKAEVLGGKLYIRGDVSTLRSKYYPVLLRRTRKSNRMGKMVNGKYLRKKMKGWNRYGNAYTIKISSEGLVSFVDYAKNGLNEINSNDASSSSYLTTASQFVNEFTDKQGNDCVSWGCSKVQKNKTLHLPFAIVFSSSSIQEHSIIDWSKVVTTMATFHISGCKSNKNSGEWVWNFSN